MSRILAVEDEAPIRSALSRALTRAGHEVVTVGDGDVALVVAERDTFDVAIVDYHMPGANGLEVLSQLRRLQPECVRMLASGALDLPVTMEAVNRGAVTRVLAKPYDYRKLITAVEESLEARVELARRVRTATDEYERAQRTMLSECLDGGVLRLAVQPIVAASDRRIVAFEGLLRSSHEVLRTPPAVLGAAERHDMLGAVGEVVARRAAVWLERLSDEVLLFVNMHPGELVDPERLCRQLAPLKPFSHRVVLEITERTRVLEVPQWHRTICALVDDGFSIAVDDLGAGYSSLSILAELQPQYIKVDMSIVRGVDTDPRKQRLIDLLAKFANATDAKLIAEGVETEAEAVAVVESGADLLQGYLLGRPTLEYHTA